MRAVLPEPQSSPFAESPWRSPHSPAWVLLTLARGEESGGWKGPRPVSGQEAPLQAFHVPVGASVSCGFFFGDVGTMSLGILGA